jgi:hypothetical protein
MTKLLLSFPELQRERQREKGREIHTERHVLATQSHVQLSNWSY